MGSSNKVNLSTCLWFASIESRINRTHSLSNSEIFEKSYIDVTFWLIPNLRPCFELKKFAKPAELCVNLRCLPRFQINKSQVQ